MSQQDLRSVTIRVPGSSANLGPGFDCVGIAWNIYNEITFTLTEAPGLLVTGCEEQYANEYNLANIAFVEVIKQTGRKFGRRGLRIEFGETQIPVSRGLGSSASLIDAGVLAANELLETGLSENELFAIATNLEGHPDNIAPAMFGGLTAGVMDNGRAIYAHYDVTDKLHFTAMIPSFELSTQLARTVLPKAVTMQDAIFNLSRTALLIRALETGDSGLLSVALKDQIHQQYRARLINDYYAMKHIAEQAGCTGFCISGAGPTLLAFSDNEMVAERIRNSLAWQRVWKVLPLKIGNGAEIIRNF